MEHVILQSIIQASRAGTDWGALLCVLLTLLLKIGIVVGLVGGCALFFAKPGEGA